MFCLLRPEVCNVIADIELFNKDLNEDGEPVVIFESTIKGHFQQTIKQVINNDRRTQERVGVYLTPAKSIPENLDFSGGTLKINNKEYFITDIVANYDLQSKLNYWTIETQ